MESSILEHDTPSRFLENQQEAEAYFQAGMAAHKARRLPEAVALYAKALQCAPHEITFYLSYSRALMESGDSQRAIAYLKQTLRIRPDYQAAAELLAQTYLSIGELQHCSDAVRKFLPSFPTSTTLYQLLIDSGQMQPGEEAALLDSGNAPATAQDTRPQALAALALARYFDGQKNYEQASHYMRLGNELNFTRMFPSVEACNAQIDRLPDATERFFADWNPETTTVEGIHASPHPIFIVGSPRSGTTLVEQILASHAAIYGGGELNYLGLMLKQCVREHPGSKLANITAHLSPQEMRALGNMYLERIARDCNKPQAIFITNKLPGNFMFLGIIRMLFPHAKIIHCQRDIRDTCLSMLIRGLGDGNFYSFHPETAAHYQKRYLQMMGFWESKMPGCIHTIQYENLVDDLEGETRKMLDFIDVPWDENCLSFYNTKRVVLSASMGQVTQPIFRTSLRRWEHYQEYLAPVLRMAEHP